MNLFGMVTTKVSWEYTSYALKSFFRKTKLGEEDRLFLIDNDGSFEEEASWFSPQLEILKNRIPLSMGANFNQLMKIAANGNGDLFLLHNDIIFTDGWFDQINSTTDTILSPLSNKNIQYEVKGTVWAAALKLNAYLGKEALLREAVKMHKEKHKGLQKILCTPFFCVKIPHSIYSVVGTIDEDLEPGSGQDGDYCLRAYSEGFSIAYARESFVLHFGGGSVKSGDEADGEKESRTLESHAIFENRWGKKLAQLILEEKMDVLEGEGLLEAYQNGDFKNLIEKLKP